MESEGVDREDSESEDDDREEGEHERQQPLVCLAQGRTFIGGISRQSWHAD